MNVPRYGISIRKPRRRGFTAAPRENIQRPLAALAKTITRR